jgi:hypothetical protein
MVISRKHLDACGGIEVVCDAVADDLRIARVLRQNGHTLALSTHPIVHRTAEESASIWARRYLRWAVCRRSEAPLLPALSLLLHPIVIPVIIAFVHVDAIAVTAALMAAMMRVLYASAADALLLGPHDVRMGKAVFLRPLAEVLDAAFVVVAMFTRNLTWRGVSYQVDLRGRLSRNEVAAHPLTSRSGARHARVT